MPTVLTTGKIPRRTPEQACLQAELQAGAEVQAAPFRWTRDAVIQRFCVSEPGVPWHSRYDSMVAMADALAEFYNKELERLREVEAMQDAIDEARGSYTCPECDEQVCVCDWFDEATDKMEPVTLATARQEIADREAVR